MMSSRVQPYIRSAAGLAVDGAISVQDDDGIRRILEEQPIRSSLSRRACSAFCAR